MNVLPECMRYSMKQQRCCCRRHRLFCTAATSRMSNSIQQCQQSDV